MLETTKFSPEKTHFTYKDRPDLSSLCQGDILQISDELKAVLEEVHPYFLNEQYKYFMVLTQSCDLVRRNKEKCKTPYITLAAIRSFNSLFERLLISGKLVEDKNGFLLMDSKNMSRAYQLLERLYNNTEPEYFFLYKDTVAGFSESMVASLKVSIALKSELHYDVCLAAKVVELSDEFKAKLGWLVGNMYSRVGTTDWESLLTKSQRSEMLSNELKSHCIIGAKSQIRALKAEIEAHAEQIQSQEDAEKFISACDVETKYDVVLKEIEDVIHRTKLSVQPEEKEKLINAIRSRNKIKSLLTT